MLPFLLTATAQPPELLQTVLVAEWQPPFVGAPRLEKVHEEIYSKLDLPYLRVAFLVDPVALRNHPKGEPARGWILKGRVWCARRTVVLQGIGEDVRLDGVIQQLRTHWPERTFDPQRPSVAAYLKLLSRPLHRRDTLDYVWQPGGRTYIRHGSEVWTTFSDRVLQRALLRIAFGNETDPDTPALGRALETFAPKG